MFEHFRDMIMRDCNLSNVLVFCRLFCLFRERSTVLLFALHSIFWFPWFRLLEAGVQRRWLQRSVCVAMLRYFYAECTKLIYRFTKPQHFLSQREKCRPLFLGWPNSCRRHFRCIIHAAPANDIDKRLTPFAVVMLRLSLAWYSDQLNLIYLIY